MREARANITRPSTWSAATVSPGRVGADGDELALVLIEGVARHRATTSALAGWPIATGTVEGACRHLVKDRLELTGARWGLTGAEANLTLRSVLANGDFDAYWAHHLTA
jgi:hypothetical protein